MARLRHVAARCRLVAASSAGWVQPSFITLPPVAASLPSLALGGSGEVSPRCPLSPPRCSLVPLRYRLVAA
eukprot:1806627-Pyramimonas_sp.AAC.1